MREESTPAPRGPARRRRLRRSLVVIAVVLGLAAVAVAATYVVASRYFETIIQEAIEREGTDAVGSPVGVDGVDLSMLSGEAHLEDLTVDNPPDFEAPHILRIRKVAARLDPWTLLDETGPVVVHDVVVSDPMITVEASRHTSNLAVLDRHAGGGLSSRRAPPRDADGAETTSDSGGRKMRIERLALKRVRVEVLFHARRRSFRKAATLDDIVLRDLGGPDGAPPDQLAREVLRAVTTKAKGALRSGRGPLGRIGSKILKVLDEELGEGGLDELRRAGKRLLERRKAGKAGKAARRLGRGLLREREPEP